MNKFWIFAILVILVLSYGLYSSNHEELVKADLTYKTVITTLFWVGEAEGEDNGFIQNRESYWDSFWMDHFGGVDSPDDRCGYNPCKFVPKENPFYFALPYGDRDADGNQRMTIQKNRWIEIKYKGKTCYAQWEDVGPFETDDYDYVFGSSTPKNQFGVRAGLDISPAVWSCLGLTDNSLTSWKFVSPDQVPPGPWLTTVTIRGLSF
jgi:hypothetical protein